MADTKTALTNNIFDFVPGDATDYGKDEDRVIVFQEDTVGAEIRDTETGNTITIYRPKREYNFDSDHSAGGRYIVAPGYINARSFTLGDQRTTKRTTEKVMRDVMVYQRMMGLAIYTLNRYNEVITTWPDFGVPNAAQVAHQQMERADRMARRLKAIDDVREKEAARRAKKAGSK